jgi:asparagine synthase (glutamine-hydrolysing)
MCGFTGFINLSNKPLDVNALKRMTDVQSHRGPDDQGFVGFSLFENKKIQPIENFETSWSHLTSGIGFNRLSIQDLSINGHQPMISPCGNYAIAYNGETYNAHDYKQELISSGFNFRSGTDTEVLLYLYMHFGIDGMLKRLNGMFAFVIVDLIESKSYIVRDQLGIKPLYIYQKNGLVLFSSEIKSFKQHQAFEAKLNTENLDEYLLFRYCANERTLFKDVNQVQPGHYYEITSSGIKEKKYWDFDLTNNENLNENDALELLNSTFKKSVRSQLISDVLVGCQLSGGIDSSLVTSYAREYFNANMDTFSIVFTDEKYSEENFINYITKLTASDSHRYQYSNNYVFENFYSATWHLDQPISIPNTLGIKRLAERSSENVKVLLSGEGADELFGGYSRYHDLSCRLNFNISNYKHIPLLGNRLTRKYLPELSVEDFFILSSSAMNIKDFNMFGKDLNKTLQTRKMVFPTSGDLIKRASVYDMRTYMVDLLNRQDKMTMAHSIENRVPFLDMNMINLVSKIPSSLIVKTCSKFNDLNKPNQYTKFLLKKLASLRFDKHFVFREKSGFPLPISDLFLKTDMYQLIEDKILPGIKNRGIFTYQEVLKIWNRKNVGLSSSDLKNLWMFFAFEVWAQVFIDENN